MIAHAARALHDVGVRSIWLPAALCALAAATAGCGSGGEPAGAAAGASQPPRIDAPAEAPIASAGTAPLPLAVRLHSGEPDPVALRFKRPPRAGLLFDLDTGRVLWRRKPTRVLPIASLTKMMTALLATERLEPGDKVRISKRALAYKGTGIGLLKRGMRVRAETMLTALMMFSANDAAIALAERIAGDVPRFVAMMNRRARKLGLTCTRFSSPDGFRDSGNHSCATDLAALARANLAVPRIARLAVTRRTIVPFPGKSRRLWVYSHNPLLRMKYKGATGLKTGYTDAAGQCFVGTARRGGIGLGVVLLHASNPGKQAQQLLDRGFAAVQRDG